MRFHTVRPHSAASLGLSSSMYNDDDFIVGSRLELYNLSVKWTIMVLNMYECGWGSNNFGSLCAIEQV